MVGPSVENDTGSHMASACRIVFMGVTGPGPAKSTPRALFTQGCWDRDPVFNQRKRVRVRMRAHTQTH